VYNVKTNLDTPVSILAGPAAHVAPAVATTLAACAASPCVTQPLGGKAASGHAIADSGHCRSTKGHKAHLPPSPPVAGSIRPGPLGSGPLGSAIGNGVVASQNGPSAPPVDRSGSGGSVSGSGSGSAGFGSISGSGDGGGSGASSYGLSALDSDSNEGAQSRVESNVYVSIYRAICTYVVNVYGSSSDGLSALDSNEGAQL